MNFSADETEEVVFSYKGEKSIHLILKLGDEIISTKSEHLMVILYTINMIQVSS